MDSPETSGERFGEYDNPTQPNCLLLGIRAATEQDRPISDGVGEITLDVPVLNTSAVRVKMRKCGTCAVECVLAEYINSGPVFAAPAGEQTFLSECPTLK